ncbi:DUF1569 domain-containing protein [Leptospira ilyithenensis]|uniref:DUF1569 domain-containing protein n=2 Tax=Leptospira ilyithenensis TaxID=2484901 RepID=A0A4R9LSI6_9LEPT|nr:DUF1569 domain-containing protein [Leptospira ilyithenensis]
MRSESIVVTDTDFITKVNSLKSLKETKDFLATLIPRESLLFISGEWSLGKVFSHCAQSIEYSMNGFPEMKSAVFQGTVGKLAFSIFSLREKMSHGLEDPIPGAADLENAIEYKLGLSRLLQSIDLFQKQESSQLKPHFAYGELDKEEFDLAHTLHIKNHFERIAKKIS